MKVLPIEVLIIVCQSVKHLGCALRIANVLDFVFTSACYDFADVCRVIVKPHVREVKVPVVSV